MGDEFAPGAGAKIQDRFASCVVEVCAFDEKIPQSKIGLSGFHNDLCVSVNVAYKATVSLADIFGDLAAVDVRAAVSFDNGEFVHVAFPLCHV
jgi:hypothetical protein